MANVNHANLTDPELHEPKGAASAAADSFYVADGAGSGSWKKRVVKLTATLSPTSSTTGINSQTVTVTGVLATDTLIGVEPPSMGNSGLMVGRVAGLNAVTLQWWGVENPMIEGVPFNPPSGTYTFILYRP